MTTVYDELSKATEVTPKDGEEAAAFSKRLAKAVDKLGDDEWKGLSDDAQNWVNDVVDAVAKKTKVPTVPGFPGADEDDEEEPAPKSAKKADKKAAAKTESKDKGKTAAKSAKPAKAESAKPAAKTKAKGANGASKERPLGKRAAIEAAAREGKLPAVPDFSADTHKPWRKRLAEVVALVKAKDIKGLKKYEINPYSTSPKAIDRYRNLAVMALEASK